MNILALDLGTHCGWALLTHGRIESGVQIFDVKRGESPGMRFLRFRRWLEEMTAHARTPVNLVVYEQPHHRGGAATEVAVGFSTRVQEQCAAVSIEHAAVHSATLKKFTTGDGRADKAAMLHHAMSRGWLNHGTSGGCGEDEVDAVCVLRWAMETIVGPTKTNERVSPAQVT